jgi:two-component system, LytTR family, response regulator
MNKATAILVDDEKHSRIVLAELLKNCCPEIEVIAEANQIELAYQLIQLQKPDIVFLDIQMPNGNGFSLLQKFDNINFQVIFVTSHNQYALNAIKFNALDYILKPVDIDELKNAVKKAVSAQSAKQYQQAQLINFIHNMDDSETEKKMLVHDKDNVRLLPIHQIISVQGQSNYAKIILDNNENFVTSKTLKEFENYFSNFPFMVRIHKEVIININQIKHYSKTDPVSVMMNNGSSFLISRRKKQEILAQLKH